MTSDSYYLELPDDPELAFLEVEKERRKWLADNIEQSGSEFQTELSYIQYFNAVVGSAIALNISTFSERDVPPPGENMQTHYMVFNGKLQNFKAQVQVRHSRRVQKYSVPLNSETSRKIHSVLSKLKELTARLEISEKKKEAILEKIISLEGEIDRSRTRFEVVAAFMIEVATVGEEVGQKLEPWRRWVDSVAKLLGFAKDAESGTLSLPNTPQQLPAPDDLIDETLDTKEMDEES